MKRYVALFLSLVCIVTVSGCNNAAISDNQPSEQMTATEKVKTDVIPMIMVKGELYYDTGKESKIDGRCGLMDGEITTSVDGSVIPTEDNQ